MCVFTGRKHYTEYWQDMPEKVLRSTDPEYQLEELTDKKEEYRMINIQRTNQLAATENLLKEVRKILGVAEGQSVTDQAQKRMDRIRELEEFIEEIDHQYETMQQIKAWCDAYPADVFTMPDWVEAKEKLGSKLLTQVGAANMRHVVDGIRNIITECEKNSSQ